MVPDIDAYAPYIDAVFSSHKAHTHDGDKQHGEYHIPWAIADQSMAQEDPLIDSFLRLLNLPDSRLLITDVQDWLDVPAIRARFEFKRRRFTRIARLVRPRAHPLGAGCAASRTAGLTGV